LFSQRKGQGVSLSGIEKKRHCEVWLRRLKGMINIEIDAAKLGRLSGAVFGIYQDFQIACF
jgi:hypothetical protein